MSELYHALGDTDYGEVLYENVRFSRFKPDWLENWMWCEMLGQDVNNYEHMEYTAGITAWYIYEAERLGTPFSKDDQDLLITTAFVHDFAEAIDGDIPDPEKKNDDAEKSQERRSFEAVASSVTDDPEGLANYVLPVIQGSHRLSRDFRAIEIIGYNETGEQAGYLASHMGEIQYKYDFDLRHLSDLFFNLRRLNEEVVSSCIDKLGTQFNDLPVVREYLNRYGS